MGASKEAYMQVTQDLFEDQDGYAYSYQSYEDEARLRDEDDYWNSEADLDAAIEQHELAQHYAF